MSRSTRLALLISLLVLLLAAGPGCGRKNWPEPGAEQERFSFAAPTGNLVNGCLEVRARVQGKSENLSRLVLELARSGEGGDCPGCPFHAQERIEVPLDAPNLKLGKRSLLLTQCGLDPGAAYRWRLAGSNSYPGIAPVTTRPLFNAP